MKKFGIFVIANITAIWIATQILTGIQVTGGIIAYIFLALALSVVNWGVKPIIKFFTLPINFATFGLFNMVLNIALFYLIKFVVPGFEITSGQFIGLKTSVLVIPPWQIDVVVTVILGAITVSIIASLVDWLLGGSKSSD
jgi:putative membrane protein